VAPSFLENVGKCGKIWNKYQSTSFDKNKCYTIIFCTSFLGNINKIKTLSRKYFYTKIEKIKEIIFKVCKSVHHHTIQINQPTKCNNFSSLLLDVYLQLNMFWASSRPSSRVQQLQQHPMVLPSERGDSSAVGRGGTDTISH
jgi:hypothetical protein